MVRIEVDGVASPRRVAEDLAGARFRVDAAGEKVVVAVASRPREELEQLVALWERDGVVRRARLVA